MKLAIIFFSFCILNTSCKRQDKEKCSDKVILNKIKKLPAVIKDNIELKKQNKLIVYQIYNDTINNKVYRVVKEAVDDKFHISTLNLYYINEDCNIFLYDTIKDSLSPIIKNQKSMETNSKTVVEFTDLFNDGTNVKFTPNDLNQDKPEIESFKKKLNLYETENPLLEDFDSKNLSTLINNETFFDLQHYTDSSWLQYFITKYKIDGSKLHDLMDEAIRQEDYNAVKILISNHYIISKKDIQTFSETEKDSKDKIAENKTDGYESYLVANSKINQISKILYIKLSTNHIQDPDGYTNLRKEKNSTSEILQKINTGEKIEVLDNFGDWFLVKTKEGKEGYVYKSRIKSN
ncbi:SH3 domain-containing protein [Halpernia frigidisoli]|uniref:SH3 domain-containing protein n=1 Tax=Halpernia frigidisoli TaxID=1125876 RepID=A0A1I3IQD1_9FLAO|nr:SH3 domain-containing protein [Halpernia frigidisoli]SFI50171.1 SH3 domain-containing protein [Halpernia frigidisoli]